MGAFNLVKNGLALVAGVALLDVILEEFGDNPSPKYSETDRERRYRESVDKMAEMKVDEAKEKMEKAQKLANEKERQYDELTKEVREMLVKVSKMVKDRAGDDVEVVTGNETINEENSEAEEQSEPLELMDTGKNVSDTTDVNETELAELKKQLVELEKKLQDKTEEVEELQNKMEEKAEEESEE